MENADAMTDTCETCRYFKIKPGAKNVFGLCRYDPHHEQRQPSDWCGKYERYGWKDDGTVFHKSDQPGLTVVEGPSVHWPSKEFLAERGYQTADIPARVVERPNSELTANVNATVWSEPHEPTEPPPSPTATEAKAARKRGGRKADQKAV